VSLAIYITSISIKDISKMTSKNMKNCLVLFLIVSIYMLIPVSGFAKCWSDCWMGGCSRICDTVEEAIDDVQSRCSTTLCSCCGITIEDFGDKFPLIRGHVPGKQCPCPPSVCTNNQCPDGCLCGGSSAGFTHNNYHSPLLEPYYYSKSPTDGNVNGDAPNSCYFGQSGNK